MLTTGDSRLRAVAKLRAEYRIAIEAGEAGPYDLRLGAYERADGTVPHEGEIEEWASAIERSEHGGTPYGNHLAARKTAGNITEMGISFLPPKVRERFTGRRLASLTREVGVTRGR